MKIVVIKKFAHNHYSQRRYSVLTAHHNPLNRLITRPLFFRYSRYYSVIGYSSVLSPIASSNSCQTWQGNVTVKTPQQCLKSKQLRDYVL